MITTIYLVKKNPNKPNSEDNWLMMSIAEFNEFVKTPEAKGRYFADLGAHEYSDIWYVAECDKETALKWRKELNRHYYLKRMERESGLQTVSMSSLIIEDEEYNGEEIIADPDADVVAEVMQKMDFALLEKALDSLTLDEYELIYRLVLSGDEGSDNDYAAEKKVSPPAVCKRKKRILKKIKNFFENEG